MRRPTTPAELGSVDPAALGGFEVVGLPVEFTRPLALLALPVAAAVVAGLLLYRRNGLATRRTRLALLATRLVIVTCLVVAAAGPVTIATEQVGGDPAVTILEDRSESMAVQPAVVDDLATDVEAEGVAVDRQVIAEGERSRVGDGVVANLDAEGSVLLVSDGQVTAGRDLDTAATAARELNATVNAVALSPDRTERAVRIEGPERTTAGIDAEFAVVVDGVESEAGTDPAELVVSVDGEEVERTEVSDVGTTVSVRRTFSSPGSHRITARLAADDRFEENDVARATVEVVPEPRVLYVADGEYPLADYLDRLYDVQTAESVPGDLDGYQTVVLQNVPAESAGNVTALQDHVLAGNGLVVVGGDDAYENGGYATSRLGAMVPVREGEGRDRNARVVLLVDISGSAAEGMTQQKAIALDALAQLGDEAEVGVVAFNREAYEIAQPRQLGTDRELLGSRIRRLEPGGGTDIAAGLAGASDMLGDGSGTVILVSDGGDDLEPSASAAAGLRERGHRVISVGAGDRIDAEVLGAVGDASGGAYVRPDETDRLRIVFDETDEGFGGDSLTVVDRGHFVTAGATTTATLPESNDVVVKRGGTHLVATARGDPAMAAWHYGVGRVVSITAHGGDGRLHGLLSEPDSLLVTRSVNWAIGDPERGRQGVTVPDTRVGESTTAVYRGDERPSVSDPSFERVDEERYEASIRPDEPGYERVLDAEYAVEYPVEYAEVGRSPALDRLVAGTGGRTFAPDDGEAIAEAVASQVRRERRVRTSRDWVPLFLALVVFLGEVCIRRLAAHRGYEGIP